MSQEHLFLSVKVSDGFLKTPLSFVTIQQEVVPRASDVVITRGVFTKAKVTSLMQMSEMLEERESRIYWRLRSFSTLKYFYDSKFH